MPITRAYAQAAEPGNFFVAGKNKIINGDFGIWQRGTSFTATGYTVDRFRTIYSTLSSGGSMTVSQQTFTPGTAPVAGYEGLFFTRLARTSSASNSTVLSQPIEDVRTFAGQTVTLSYWAKVSSGTTTNEPSYIRNYGSGGSSQDETVLSAVTLTTSWQRFSHTFTVPSVSGKTIGSSSFLEPLVIRNVNSVSTTIDIWGVQLEAGAVATPFTTATGTLAGELNACQRYYWQGSGFQQTGGTQTSANETSIFMPLNVFNAVPMRTTPTPSITGTSYITDFNSNLRTVTSLAMVQTSMVRVNYDSTKLTSATPYGINVTGAGASFIFSSEL